MTLWIRLTSNYDDKYEHDLMWHVGELTIAIGDYNTITEVQATGDESILIRREFYNIRMTNSRIVNWYGDEAKFIAKNLDNCLPFRKVKDIVYIYRLEKRK